MLRFFRKHNSLHRSLRNSSRHFTASRNDDSSTQASNFDIKSDKADSQSLPEDEKSPQTFFSQEELQQPQLNHKSLTKLVQYCAQKKEVGDIFLRELSFLYEDANIYDSISKKIKSLKEINVLNSDKIEALKNHIKLQEDEEKESTNRLASQLENEKIFCISKIARECLDITDNIERCIEITRKQYSDLLEAKKGKDTIFEVLEDVLKLIRRKYATFGINVMTVENGMIVNPNFHEIVFFVPYPSMKDDTIIDTPQKGYLIQERILRPAKVGVVKN